MDFNWFFKNGRYRPNQPDSSFDEHDIRSCDHDEEVNSSEVPFMEPFGNVDEATRGLFQHMEDMLNHMFSSSFIPFGSIKLEENTASDPRSLLLKDPDFKRCEENHDAKFSEMIIPDNFTDSGSIKLEDNTPSDPRSLMLKDPDFKRREENHDAKFSEMIIPDNFTDSDIDEQVARHGLILDDKKPESRMPTLFSYKKFSSIRTVHLPDGTVEEHRKFTDNQGNITTTIRRSIGNQSYEVTTHADNQGIKEKEENLTNLDESEISDFEKRWLNMKNGKLPIQEPSSDLVLPKSAPAGDPSYSSIFKKFFGL